MLKKITINILLLIFSGLILYSYFSYNLTGWKYYQNKYKEEKLKKLYKKYKKEKDKDILNEINNVKNFQIKKRAIYATKWKREEYCVTCHIGIKDISQSHPSNVFGCVICHGGEPLSVEKKEAHKGLIGGNNPSNLKYARKTCGTDNCHKNEIKRVETSLMFTMAGVIADLRYQWNAQKTKDAIYATNNVKDDYGKKLQEIPFYTLKDVPKNYKKEYKISGEIADSHFRKFCSMCHIGAKNPNSTSNHSSGCAACHVIYENSSHYKGEDPTIDKEESGHPPFHTITKKIPTSQCLHCHNRSNRYGTSYIGIAENDFYGTPYTNGNLSPNRMIGGRYYYHLQPDIHYKAGMDCIDCHTSNEIMGDGKIYSKMDKAIKVKCEDCHGTFSKLPLLRKIKDISDKLLSKYSQLNLNDSVLFTDRGEILYNVKKEKDKLMLTTKLKGKKLEIKTVYQNEKHKINNCNKNMECYTCHYSWTMLCYGCHIGYNSNYPQRDFLTNYKSKGRWFEFRSYTRYTDTVLGINSRNKIAPMQFCQSQVTFKSKGYDNKVFIHEDNTTSYVVAPVQPHTITKLSKKCKDCHNNPMAVGLGRGYLKFTNNEKIIFKPIYNMKKAGINVSFPFETIVSDDGKIQYQSVSNKKFKVLKSKKILKILRVGRCTPCHNSYDDKIYKNNNFTFFYNKIKKDNFKHIKVMRQLSN